MPAGPRQPEAADQREQSARYHDEGGGGVEAGDPNKTGRHERRRAAESGEGHVEAERDAAEADARRKQVRQQNRERAVDEAGGDARQQEQHGRVHAPTGERGVKRKRQRHEHERARAQQNARMDVVRESSNGENPKGVDDDADRLRDDGLARIVLQDARQIRCHVREVQAVESCGRSEHRNAHRDGHEMKP